MFSEDLAFMLEARLGAFIMIGAGEGAQMLTAEYDFNDEILTLGAAYWVSLTERALL
jgi:metal-dependent amidase/aminoacylase/carboxypeptidase family protein